MKKQRKDNIYCKSERREKLVLKNINNSKSSFSKILDLKVSFIIYLISQWLIVNKVHAVFILCFITSNVSDKYSLFSLFEKLTNGSQYVIGNIFALQPWSLVLDSACWNYFAIVLLLFDLFLYARVRMELLFYLWFFYNEWQIWNVFAELLARSWNIFRVTSSKN